MGLVLFLLLTNLPEWLEEDRRIVTYDDETVITFADKAIENLIRKTNTTKSNKTKLH